MSSPSSSTGTTDWMDHQTYRCTSCNTDVSPITRLTCHHCNSILPPISNPNSNNQNPSQLPPQSVINPSVPSTTARRFPSDDNFRLDSPYFQRLIHHLRHSNDSSPITTTTTTAVSRHHSPTSKSAIESIPIVTITSAFLEIDPIVLCAICKDQFVIDDETKQLPCKHMYHPHCILPWLSNHNSCPVCRFQLPKEVVDVSVRRSRSRVLRFGDLMEEVDDEAMLGLGFTNLHNHQYLEPMDSPNVAFPYTHIGQTVDVDVLPDSELDNGVEGVSGWSSWGMNLGGDGDGDVAMP